MACWLAGSNTRTYYFLGCDFCPVNVKMSLSPELFVSSMRRLYRPVDEGEVSVVERESDVCGGLWLSTLWIRKRTRTGTLQARLTFDAAKLPWRVVAACYAVADVQTEVRLLVRFDATLKHRGRHSTRPPLRLLPKCEGKKENRRIILRTLRYQQSGPEWNDSCLRSSAALFTLTGSRDAGRSGLGRSACRLPQLAHPTPAPLILASLDISTHAEQCLYVKRAVP